MGSAAALAPPVAPARLTQRGAGARADGSAEPVKSEPLKKVVPPVGKCATTPTGPPVGAELADAVLRALDPDKWYSPVRAAFFLARAGVPDAPAALAAALAAGWLDTEPGTGAVAYAERCWLPGRLLPPGTLTTTSAASTAPAHTGSPPPRAVAPAPSLSAVGPWFSYYAGPVNAPDPRPAVSITVGALVHALTNPTPRLRALADRVRAAYGTPEYDRLKTRLDYVTPAGTFAHRKADGLLRRSGLLVLDFDKLADVGAVRAALLADPVLRPLLVLLFVSPSGAGLKCLLTVGTDEPHAEAFAVLRGYLTARYGPTALNLDKNGSDLPRACFVGYDLAPWVAPAYAPPTP